MRELWSLLKTVISPGTFNQMLRSATPVALAAMGGALTEHAGIMNIGMDGMILLGAFVLIWTGIASWKIMASSVAGALFVGIAANAAGISDIPAYWHLVMGGFAFGTVFMATDPVTSAQTETGKWIYGFLMC